MAKNRYPYVATETIEVPPGSGFVAFVEGQEVPAESVENLGIQDQVRSTNTRRSATSQLSPPPSSSPSSSSSS